MDTKKEKKHKRATVEGFLPDLKSSHCYQVGIGTGSTAAIAIGRAVEDLFRKPAVRGRHIHSMKMTVSIAEIEVPKKKVPGNHSECGPDCVVTGDSCYGDQAEA